MAPEPNLADVHHDADLTGLLQAWNAGDPVALDRLTALVHQELRDIARRLLANEHRDRRWQPTELVQESFLRLLDWRTVRWENRAHFFATAARMMRRVLVDAARHRRALKRGKEFEILPLDEAASVASTHNVDFLALEDALTRLESVNAAGRRKWGATRTRGRVSTLRRRRCCASLALPIWPATSPRAAAPAPPATG